MLTRKRRFCSFKICAIFILFCDLLKKGIVAHAEELTKNFHLINILFYHTLKSANFLAFSWGDDLNEIEKRQLFSRSGINGIIYDRISEKNLANMPSSPCIGNNGNVNELSS